MSDPKSNGRTCPETRKEPSFKSKPNLYAKFNAMPPKTSPSRHVSVSQNPNTSPRTHSPTTSHHPSNRPTSSTTPTPKPKFPRNFLSTTPNPDPPTAQIPKADELASFMTERPSLRRRLHISNDRRRKPRPPHPSLSFTRGSSRSRRSAEKSIKPVKSLKRCASAPAICGGEERSSLDCDEGVLPRGTTSWDVLSTSAPSRAQSFRFPEEERGYNKEAKVVVNVTVEGSVGPIRTMVRLGSSVEDTINLTLEKYVKEGRRPRLGNDDGASFDLHDSYFSLQCLGRSDLIGDVGSRSFYLRATRKGSSSPTNTQPLIGGAVSLSAPALLTEPFAAGAATGPAQHPALLFLPGFISRRISKLVRRTRKLWKILGCMQSSG